jgi:periplasmic copper chaperone A
MKRFLSALLLTLFPSMGFTLTSNAQALPLRLAGGWVQAVPPAAAVSAAYFRILNPTDQVFELVGARTRLAESVEPMATTRDAQGMAGMESVAALRIPARGELVLQPGGNHLMLMSLREHPKPGETAALTLVINPGAREMPVLLPVLRQAQKENVK